MYAIAESVEERAEMRRNHFASAEAFQINHIFAWPNDIFGKRAVQMPAFDPRIATDVTLSGAALLAVTATDVHFTGDIIANADKSFGNIFADFDHFAAKFVTDDDGVISAH